MKELKKPLRCTYKEHKLPDEYEGRPITEAIANELFAEGEIEKEIIYKDALLLRMDNTPLVDEASGIKTAQMQATIVDIDSGNMMCGMLVDDLSLHESSVRYLVSLSEPSD